MKMSVKKLIKSMNEVLDSLRKENGLFIASWGSFYQLFCWLRDCFYESLSYLEDQPLLFQQTYHTILDYLIMLEEKYSKFSLMIKSPHPKYRYRYLHARVSAETFDEVHEEWGNKQNDVCGELLYGIAIGIEKGLNIIRNEDDIRIINLLIKYVEAIEYWHDEDSGYWEEDEQVRSSSIGAIVAGLKAMKKLNIPGIEIDEELIEKGVNALNELLPNETPTRFCDLAQLSLIYPFDVVTEEQRDAILHNVEKYLLKEEGVIRYIGDYYYNRANYYSANRYKYLNLYIEGDQDGNEARWIFGFAYLGQVYLKLGLYEKASKFLGKIFERSEGGKVGELIFKGTKILNENNPLGWSVSMTKLLSKELLKRGIIKKNTLFDVGTKIKSTQKVESIQEIEKQNIA